MLAAKGIDVEVVNASSIKPLDTVTLERVFERHRLIFTLEEHVLQGGFGSAVLEWAALNHRQNQVIPLAVEDRFIQHGDHKHLLEEVQLDDASIASIVLNACQKEGNSTNG